MTFTGWLTAFSASLSRGEHFDIFQHCSVDLLHKTWDVQVQHLAPPCWQSAPDRRLTALYIHVVGPHNVSSDRAAIKLFLTLRLQFGVGLWRSIGRLTNSCATSVSPAADALINRPEFMCWPVLGSIWSPRAKAPSGNLLGATALAAISWPATDPPLA